MIQAPVNVALTHVTPTLLPILLFPLHDQILTSLFLTRFDYRHSQSPCAYLLPHLFSTLGLRPYLTLCVPYSTLPYSLLYSMGTYSTRPYSWLRPYSISTPMWRLPDMCIPYTLSI